MEPHGSYPANRVLALVTGEGEVDEDTCINLFLVAVTKYPRLEIL